MTDKAYMIVGAAICMFFFYSTQSGITILAWNAVSHTRPVGPGIHHK